MALTSKWFCKAFDAAFSSTGLNLKTGSVKVLLTNSTYVPDQDAHAFLSDVTNELSGGSYARVALTGKAVSLDAATNKVKFTSDAVTFPGLTSAGFRNALFFIDSGTAATSPLILAVISDTDLTASGQDVTLTPQSTGWSDVTVS